MLLPDWILVGVYFAIIVAIVYRSSRRVSNTADYFLAGRHVGWFVVGASLFASNIGSEHIVGLSGNGASSGMAMAHWELHAWIMILLGWIFVPFYYKSGVFTMPEFLERRFDARVRWVLSIVSLVAYVFTKVSVTVYAGALVFKTLLPDTFGSPDNAFWVGALVTVILTGIYTVFGGLRAVVYTEVAQTALLLTGSLFITYFGLRELGGWGELRSLASENREQFALWRANSHPDFPWLGILIASPVIGIWYWCTDQYIVQRTLAAKNLANARRGAIWGGFLKVWPVMIFLVPGLIGWALDRKHNRSIHDAVAQAGIVAGLNTAEAGARVAAINDRLEAAGTRFHIPRRLDPGTERAGDERVVVDGDLVFPSMVASLLPTGLRGLVVAGLLSALMSSLASLFNSCATLFTVDIYEKLRPGRPERDLVRVGRLATGVVVLCGIVWIPIMNRMAEGGLYKYLQGVQSYLAPPITAVFLLGLFWKRCNARGALWGLVTGFVLGMLKLSAEAVHGSRPFVAGSLAERFAGFNFLFYSGVLLALSVLIVVGFSLSSPPPDPGRITGLTYGSLTADDRKEIRASWSTGDVLGTIVVLGLVLAFYLYFSFWLG